MLDDGQTVAEQTLFVKAANIVVVFENRYHGILHTVLGAVVIMDNGIGELAEVNNVPFYKRFQKFGIRRAALKGHWAYLLSTHLY